MILNLVFQIVSAFLVLLTYFVGAWDCSTNNVDNQCDTLFKYHLGEGKATTIVFGWNSLSQCEMAAASESKCW